MSTAGYKRECEEAAADAATKLEITAQDVALRAFRVGRVDESQGKLVASSVPFHREGITTHGKDTVSRRKPAS